MRRTAFFPLFFLPCVFLPGSLVAQTVVGVVVDAVTERPVVGASVLLVDDEHKVQTGVVTSVDGAYALHAPKPGLYTLRVDAEVYTSLVSPAFEINANQSHTIDLRIAKQEATQLAAATVTGEMRPFLPGPLRGFHERKQRGWGSFVMREDIEAKMPVKFSSALRLVSDVKIIRMPKRPGRPLTAAQAFTIRITGMQRSCVPIVYLDGVKLGPADDLADGRGPDFLVHPHDLEGIEVYRPAYVPGEFSGSDAMCGVIVAWTRRSH